MIPPPADDPKARAAKAYNAAADCYDEPALSFWDKFGRRTVERLSLKSGAQVLDVCCGSGASAIPAAECVGATGLVLGVDLAANLLDRASAKARQCNLGHLELRIADMEKLGFPDGSFDAVVCVFGIFFVPDMTRAVRELWRMVRPSGQLAITTWGPDLFEPGNSVFWNAVRAERPELYKSFNPWDRINTSDALRQLLREAGVEVCDTVAEPYQHPLNSPEDWWTIALGSGYRGTIEQLDAAARERVRKCNLRHIRDHSITSIQASVVYAIATK